VASLSNHNGFPPPAGIAQGERKTSFAGSLIKIKNKIAMKNLFKYGFLDKNKGI